MADQNPGNVQQNQQTVTANLVEIWMAGRKIGYLQDFSGNNSYGLEALFGIGDIHAQEYYPTRATHTISCSRAVIRKDSLEKLLGTQFGGGTGGNPFINGDGALQGVVFDVALVQKASSSQSGTTIRKWVHCSLDSDDTSVRANALLMNNVRLYALDVQEDGSGAGFKGVTDMDATSGQ